MRILISVCGCPATEAVGCFEAFEGASVALVGPNGSGKSSLLRLIMTGQAPHPLDTCRVSICGRSLENAGPHERASAGVGYVPSERAVFPELSVEENIKLGLLAAGVPRGERGRAIEEIYRVFPLLRQRRKQLAGTLSGGEQKILSIARATAARPRILLVDEPSAGLSPKAVDAVYGIFKDLRSRGVAVVIAEQGVWPLTRNRGSVDVCYIMHNKRILARIGPEELETEDVKARYFGLRG